MDRLEAGGFEKSDFASTVRSGNNASAGAGARTRRATRADARPRHSTDHLSPRPDQDTAARPHMSAALTEQYRALLASGEIEADPDQERIVARLEALSAELQDYAGASRTSGIASWFAKPVDMPRGLYIHGGVGRGKTMLMDLFFEHAPIEPKTRIHFHEFMQDVHSKVHHFRQNQSKGYVSGADPIPPVADEVARKAKLLCFDEFQVSDITDAMILGRLFTALFERGVVMVATSNRHPDTLYENGLNRALFLPFIAMLKDRLEVVALDGATDYRLERLEGMSLYYSPLGKDADKRMNEAWNRLTNAAAGAEAQIEVKGRTITVPRAAKGVARFSFSELCERPLGAADYLKLARTFHTLLLDKIPEMGPEKRNEARRFINLVDTLYNARVKLIASAAAEPDAIYVSGDGSFEFARTASRLFEMQGDDYMALGHCS
jgi:cell division protein ZapE